MTTTEPRRATATAVPTAVVRAMVEDATAHGYGPGRGDSPTVIGIHGDPRATEAGELSHDGVPVHVRPCVSTLAAWELIRSHDPAHWLVLVTDRSEQDLGTGVLVRLVGHKLRTPDPWEAVRQQFAATGIEPALYADPRQIELARGLLDARPEAGWPPAPAGALTRTHALRAVAHTHLDLRARDLDALAVLDWTCAPGLAGRIADLRASVGDTLTDATLAWICSGAGAAAPVVTALVRRGEVADAVPIGLVLDALLDAEEGGPVAVARLEHRWQGGRVRRGALEALAETSTTVLAGLHGPAAAATRTTLIKRAESLLAEVDARHLARTSPLLPSGLDARIATLGAALRRAVGNSPTDATVLADLEHAWTEVADHQLVSEPPAGYVDARIAPIHAAVRLVRALRAVEAPTSTADGPTGRLAAFARQHADVDAWTDRAVNDAHGGVADPELAGTLGEVLAAVRAARSARDEQFARALAVANGASDVGHRIGKGDAPVWLLEHVIADAVAPIARSQLTLLLVLDGMSTSVGTEIVSDLLVAHGWVELLLPDERRRSAALAVLPTLTEASRTSLLTGRLTLGDQATERTGFAALTEALALGRTSLFHKKPIDSSRPGYAVADDIAAAIADEDQRLVACVLNTIDDALDRSDPAGTTWTVDAVRHLRPLLDQARAAGRVVVITADHGHVVERREGRQVSAADTSSSRSRSAESPAGAGEVLVSGERVLRHGGSAVLPYDERLRYGPLKAGYHGGASPAEAVVPLIVLAPSEELAERSGLAVAPLQEPAWWLGPTAAASAAIPAAGGPRSAYRPQPDDQEPNLFDALPAPLVPTLQRPASPAGPGTAVVRSKTYKDQRKRAGRVVLTDDQVVAGIDALAAAPSSRLPFDALSQRLAVQTTRARGARAQLSALLNVEGYPVVRTEGPVMVLDLVLLRDQFGLPD